MNKKGIIWLELILSLWLLAGAIIDFNENFQNYRIGLFSIHVAVSRYWHRQFETLDSKRLPYDGENLWKNF